MHPAARAGTLTVVLLLAAESAHHSSPLAAVAVGVLLVLAMLLPAALAARSSRRSRRALRFCPQCGARAVRRTGWERLAPRLTRVALECGQCATWRRVVIEDEKRRGQLRRLERDRRRLARRLRQVETARREAECRAFAALLHSKIAGAEDFLACTRPPATFRPRIAGTDEERTSP